MNKIADIISAAADKANVALKENSVLGDPITIDGIMIIPVYKLSFGFGGGGLDGTKNKNADSVAGGAGAGVTKKPVSYITIQNGEVSILYADDTTKQDFISKILSTIAKLRSK